MTNVKVVQKNLYSKSQVKVKVTGQIFLYEWEALITRNSHAKYKGSISNSSKVMTNVKVVQPTNKPTNRQGKNNISLLSVPGI